MADEKNLAPDPELDHLFSADHDPELESIFSDPKPPQEDGFLMRNAKDAWREVSPLFDALKPDDVPEGQGPLAQGFDKYAGSMKGTQDAIVGSAKDAWREIAPLFEGAKPLKPLLEPINVGLNALGTTLDAINRVAGESVAKVVDPLINLAAGPNAMTFEKRALERIARQGGSEYPTLDKYIPTRLIEDVAYPIGEESFKLAANALRKVGHNDLAHVIDGFAPGAGLATSLFVGMNMPIPKILALTEEGIAAEKTGKLALSTAEQVKAGQRGIMGLEVGGMGIPKTDLFNVKAPGFAPMFDKMNELAIKAEVAQLRVPFTQIGLPNPVRMAGKLLTKTQNPLYNKFVEDYNMALSGVRYETDALYQNFANKAKSLGTDLGDDVTKRRLWEYFEKPGNFNPKTPEEIEQLGKDQNLYNYMNANLEKEAQITRDAGVPVPEKKFSLSGDPSTAATQAERYVPRGTPLSNRQKLIAKKTLGDMEETEDFMNRIQGQPQLGSFQRERTDLTRDSMNRLMEKKYGIEDFFHDDLAAAYSDKIGDLRRARVEKEFAEKIIQNFGKDEGEYLTRIKAARAKVRLVRAEGGIPEANDVYLAALEPRGLVRYKELPENIRGRMKRIGAISEDLDVAQRMRLPEEIADHLTDVLSKPAGSEVEQALMSYQNAMKGYMFFNPGYHIRNFAENFARALGLGAGPLEHAKATAAMIKDEGPYRQYYEEMKSLAPEMTNMSMMNPVTQGTEVLNVPRGYLTEQNPLKIMMSSLKEIGAKDKWKQFLTDLRSGDKGIRDNPLFKFSTNVGVQGENMSRLAVYGKLRNEGYEATEAMRKVNNFFPDYQVTRTGLKKTSLVLPFSNYFVKNAETVMKILSDAPRGVQAMGKQGALQRSFENYAGFDPERTYRYKKIMGPWADDYIFMSVMPNAQYMDKNPDYVRQALSWVNSGLDPGDVIWTKLPTSTHALRNLDPSALHESLGPLARAGIALMGTDPFSGKPIEGTNVSSSKDSFLSAQQWERLKVAGKELVGPMIPTTTLQTTQLLLDKASDQWVDNLVNLGMPDNYVNAIFGDKTDKSRKKARQALSKVKMLWAGGATQIDMQAILGAMTRMKAAKDYVTGKIRTDKPSQSDIDSAFKEYDKALDDVGESLDAADEYQRAVERVGGKVDTTINFTEPDEVPEPTNEPSSDIPLDDSDLSNAADQMHVDQILDGRHPQSAKDDAETVKHYVNAPDEAVNHAADFYSQNPHITPQPINREPQGGPAPNQFYDPKAKSIETNPKEFFNRKQKILDYFDSRIQEAQKAVDAGDRKKADQIFQELEPQSKEYKEQSKKIQGAITDDFYNNADKGSPDFSTPAEPNRKSVNHLEMEIKKEAPDLKENYAPHMPERERKNSAVREPASGAEKTPGMIDEGNVDMSERPKVKDENGELSMSFYMDGKEILVPKISEFGRVMTDRQAVEEFIKTGKNLGTFKDAKSATEFAKKLHLKEEGKFK